MFAHETHKEANIDCDIIAGKSPRNETTEEHQPDHTANAYGNKKEKLPDKPVSQMAQEINEAIVNAEDNHQHAATQTGHDGTDANYDPFNHAQNPAGYSTHTAPRRSRFLPAFLPTFIISGSIRFSIDLISISHYSLRILSDSFSTHYCKISLHKPMQNLFL